MKDVYEIDITANSSALTAWTEGDLTRLLVLISTAATRNASIESILTWLMDLSVLLITYSSLLDVHPGVSCSCYLEIYDCGMAHDFPSLVLPASFKTE